MQHIAIFASGAGSNARNIISYFKSSADVNVVLIATNNEKAGVLAIARDAGIDALVFDKNSIQEGGSLHDELLRRKVDYVVLAGFLWKVPAYLIHAFPDRIINIHPALLPKHGGKGMYGHHVHDAVFRAGEKESGITIHFVNEQYDEGKIIFQAKYKILPGDGPAEIEAGVRALELTHFPRVLEQVILGA